MTFLTRFERWEPFEELSTLRNRMDRLVSRMSEGEEGLFKGGWTPTTDVVETSDAIILKSELPGMNEKDISIEIENGMLTMQGERNLEEKTEEKGYRRIERSYGKFIRSFALPTNVLMDHVKAMYHDGILEVTIPKKEEAKPRKIEVKTTKVIPQRKIA
jgi:HSP20 family protein